MKTPFTYGLVRYVHDPVAEEFVNVGVVVYAPKARFLAARCTQRYKRLSAFFNGVSGSHFRSLMSHIERVVNSRARELEGLSFESPPADAFAVIRSLFAIDDSSLQFTDGGGGLTRDPVSTLEELYERFVGRYEMGPRPRRDEAAVWRDVRSHLEKTGVAERLQRYHATAPRFDWEFEHAWKNGRWQALEPISFDLADGSTIKDKAARWLGRTHLLAEGRDPLQIVFITARPGKAQLRGAYEDALAILRQSPIDKNIIEETQAEELATELRRQIEEAEG